MRIADQIYNFVTEDELSLWTKALYSTDAMTITNNDCHGVSEKHMLYNWFVTNVFEKIKIALNDDKLKVTFGMYLNETNPWGIHTDAYHVQEYPNRRTALSFLMPLAVDNDQSLVTKSRTIVFNESGNTNDKIEIHQFTDKTNMPTSAVSIYNKHLSHNKLDTVKKFTIQGEYQWKRGSLIWWDGNYFHDTDNFIANGYTSKQAIVIHTYYDC